MSREQKIQLLYLYAEKERRRRLYARRYFRPQEQQKLPLETIFNGSQKEIWIFGGNRSGKTELGGYAICKYATEHWNKLIWVVSETFEAQVDTTQKKVLRYLQPNEIKRITYRFQDSIYKIFLNNGSVIHFKSYEQERKKFQGASVDLIWFDEEPPEQIYKECLMRTIDSGGKIIGTMTPVVGQKYLFDKTKNLSDNVAIFYLDTEKNEYLSREEIEKIKENYAEDELDMRLRGHFIQRSGLVYKEFDRHKHVIDPFPVPEDWYILVGIDHGWRNPTAVIWLAVDPDDNYYVIDEHYASEMTVEEHAKIINERNARYRNRGPIRIDPATAQHHGITDATIQSEFQRYGVYTIPANNNVHAGIEIVRQALRQTKADGSPRLQIFRHCVNTISEFENYVWQDVSDRSNNDNRREQPRKVNDHAMDALRYILVEKPVYIRAELRRRQRRVAGYSRTGY